MKTYWIADLRANGELLSTSEYVYEQLERLTGCAELIGHLSGEIWRAPEGFETDLAPTGGGLLLRWHSTAATAGLMTLRWKQAVVSVTVLATGINNDADALTISALQQQLVHELHGTAYEAAFSLTDLRQRPLAATMNISSPDHPALQAIAAVADRCFAAAYFRYLRLV
jgi:hypothetical protein